MKSVLLTWYGITDFRASLGFEQDGPVSGALAAEAYDEVVVLGYSDDTKQKDIGTFDDDIFIAGLNDVNKSDCRQTQEFVGKYSNTCQAHKWYCEWLESRIASFGRKTELFFSPVHLKELNDTEGIYEAALAALGDIATCPEECLITLFLSPGTPVMAFVWAFAALNFPRIKKRLISSSRPGVPPEEILLPQEWMEWNGKRVFEERSESVELDMCFHLLGEQRLPSYWGMAQYPARYHVFVTSDQFDPTPMVPFLGSAKALELKVNPYDPEDVRLKIINALESADVPATAKIGFNLTGGTKLMYAGAMAACRKINGFSFYFNQQENSVIDLLTFEKKAIKPIFSIETFLRLNSNGLHLWNAGYWEDIPNIAETGREELTEFLWQHKSDVADIYKPISVLTDVRNISGRDAKRKAREGRAPFTYPAPDSGSGLHQISVAAEWDGSAEFVMGSNAYHFENFPYFQKYIMGGWFEEYTYRQLKCLEDEGVIFDLRIGTTLSFDAQISAHSTKGGRQINSHKEERSYQEFDLLFTEGSRLYIVECKAGSVTSDHVVKLNDVVRRYGGLGGRGVLACCFPPSDPAVNKRIKECKSCRLMSGQDICEQVRALIVADRNGYI